LLKNALQAYDYSPEKHIKSLSRDRIRSERQIRERGLRQLKIMRKRTEERGETKCGKGDE